MGTSAGATGVDRIEIRDDLQTSRSLPEVRCLISTAPRYGSQIWYQATANLSVYILHVTKYAVVCLHGSVTYKYLTQT